LTLDVKRYLRCQMHLSTFLSEYIFVFLSARIERSFIHVQCIFRAFNFDHHIIITYILVHTHAYIYNIYTCIYIDTLLCSVLSLLSIFYIIIIIYWIRVRSVAVIFFVADVTQRAHLLTYTCILYTSYTVL